MPDIQSMLNKEVVVTANGVTYTGILVEVSETEVHLKTTLQWISLPTYAVTQIKLKQL